MIHWRNETVRIFFFERKLSSISLLIFAYKILIFNPFIFTKQFSLFLPSPEHTSALFLRAGFASSWRTSPYDAIFVLQFLLHTFPWPALSSHRLVKTFILKFYFNCLSGIFILFIFRRDGSFVGYLINVKIPFTWEFFNYGSLKSRDYWKNQKI